MFNQPSRDWRAFVEILRDYVFFSFYISLFQSHAFIECLSFFVLSLIVPSLTTLRDLNVPIKIAKIDVEGLPLSDVVFVDVLELRNDFLDLEIQRNSFVNCRSWRKCFLFFSSDRRNAMVANSLFSTMNVKFRCQRNC